jgi:DNA-binding winged helix-turn-helix (wHTH) protein
MEPARLFLFGDFAYDPATNLLTRHGERVTLTPLAAQTFGELILNRDRIISKQELKRRVWRAPAVEDNAIERQIALIRRALGSMQNGDSYIKTHYKRGWQFVAEVGWAAESDNAAAGTQASAPIMISGEVPQDSLEPPQAALPLPQPPIRSRRKPLLTVLALASLTALLATSIVALTRR